MSDLTSELNLALAVDDDDTADYLVQTEGLRGSLVIVDGMFNQTTGHAHNGAHQGGNLQFQNLTIGGTLTVQGGLDVASSATLRTTLHVIGATTLDAALVANSLDVTTTSRLRGTVTIDGAINSAGTLVVGQDLQVNRDLAVQRNASITGTLTVGAITTGGGGLTVGGNLSASGIISAPRAVFGGSDYGHALNVGGNGMASGYWYQRAGAARCYDTLDFTYAVAATGSTLVQRDGSGYITASYINYTGDVQGGKPTHVLGRTGGDTFLRWWPANAIGPPITTWYAQAVINLPSLSNNGASQDASFSAVALSGGFAAAGNIITVPRPGYYSVAGGFNGNNLTGNQETMDMTLISSAHGNLDAMGVPLKITSYFGGYFSWSGFLNAGETIRLNFRTSFDSINGSGEIIVAFLPTADYNN